MAERGAAPRAGRGVAGESLFAEEESVEGDGLGQRHADDGLDEDLARGTRVAPDRFNGLGADKTHANGGGDAAQAPLNITEVATDFSEELDHVMVGVYGWLHGVRALLGTVPPGKGWAAACGGGGRHG